MTAPDIAIYLIPLLLGIIAYFVKRGVKLNDEQMKEHTNMMHLLKDSINDLRVEISKLTLGQSSTDSKLVRVNEDLADHASIIGRHADKLQEHELKIAKLEKK